MSYYKQKFQPMVFIDLNEGAVLGPVMLYAKGDRLQLVSLWKKKLYNSATGPRRTTSAEM